MLHICLVRPVAHFSLLVAHFAPYASLTLEDFDQTLIKLLKDSHLTSKDLDKPF